MVHFWSIPAFLACLSLIAVVPSECYDIMPLQSDNKMSFIPSNMLDLFKANNPEVPIDSIIRSAENLKKYYGSFGSFLYTFDRFDIWSSPELLPVMVSKFRLLTEISNDFLQLFKNNTSFVSMYRKSMQNKFKEYKKVQFDFSDYTIGSSERSDVFDNILPKLGGIPEIILSDLRRLSRTFDNSIVDRLERSITFLHSATEKIYSYVVSLKETLVGETEKSMEEKPKMIDYITTFNVETPLKSGDQKENTSFFSRDISQLFKQSSSETSMMNVANTAEDVKEGYSLLSDMFGESLKPESWKNPEFLTKINLTLDLLTKVSDDFLKQSKNNVSLVGMYRKSIMNHLENLRAIHSRNSTVDVHFNYDSVNKEKFGQICGKLFHICNKISKHLVSSLYGDYPRLRESIKRLIEFLSNATRKLYSHVLLLEENKHTSEEKIQADEENILKDITDFIEMDERAQIVFF